MDTLAFLRAILPDTGVHYVVLIDGKLPAQHHPFESLEAMATAIAWREKEGRFAVYHACAGYTEPFIRNEEGKREYRTVANQACAKALWLDIDCGEGKGYPSKTLAYAALKAFCAATHLPLPLLVDSGNGLHCYWILTEPVDPTTWQGMANNLQAVCAHFELAVDTGITTDFARILRPPGTTNRKHGNVKPVVVKGVVPQPLTPTEMAGYLDAIVSTYGLATLALPEHLRNADVAVNDDLVHTNYPEVDASAVKVAEQCKQVALMRDTKGDVGYEHWFGVIGLIKHCVEGEPLAHEWSDGAKYDPQGVTVKFETWDAGPPTCAFFGKHNPEGCADCPHSGKVKSPIRLGWLEPEPVTPEVVDEQEQPVAVGRKLPPGYEWQPGVGMVRHGKDKDGIPTVQVFCEVLLYPLQRIREDDGTFHLSMRTHMPTGKVRDFRIPTGFLASNAKLMEHVGHVAEITQTNHKDAVPNMCAYLRDSLQAIKRESDELVTMGSFGWKQDGKSFLLGTRLYHHDGQVEEVLLGGHAAAYSAGFPAPQGTLAGYAEAVNRVYGVEGMEPLQYAFCSAYGSVISLFGETLYNGLLVALTSGDSGKGKTTVCFASLYGFGNAVRMAIRGPDGATRNAMYTQLGTYGSLPILLDEWGSIEPKAFSVLSYSISDGQDKDRMVASKTGVQKAQQALWRLSPYITGNRDFHAVLQQHSPNSQAEAVRLVQIKVDAYDIPQFPDGMVEAALVQMAANMGTAADAFLRWLVPHKAEARKRHEAMMDRLLPLIPGPKFRYYRAHAAVTLTAAAIMVELGIVQFDLDRLFDFAVKLMQQLAEDVSVHNSMQLEDALYAMLNDMTPGIAVTYGYQDVRVSGPEKLVNRMLAPSIGRYVIGQGNKKDNPMNGKIYLSERAIHGWCATHRVDSKAFYKFLASSGFLVERNVRFNLTKGTELPTVRTTCTVLDKDAMDAAQGLRLIKPPPPAEDELEAQVEAV